MNTVRTTVVFDEDLHKHLSMQATALGVTFSDLVNKKLANPNVVANKNIIKTQINDDLAFFHKLGKKMRKTDWAKVIREERDRDGK